jgi:hypothetical protein
MPQPLHFQQVFENSALDYFGRMGGAGTWMVPNYSDWHPAALTILIGLKHFKAITDIGFETAKIVLPSQLFEKCDRLSDRLSVAFEKVEEQLGTPERQPSFDENDLMRYLREQTKHIEQPTRQAEDRARDYGEILSNLERISSVVRELPPLEEHLRGFRFRHKAY